MSLPHFPSLPVFPLGYLSYHACANIVAKYEAHILKTQEWKLEHEKLDRKLFEKIHRLIPLFHGEDRDFFVEMERKILGAEEKKKGLGLSETDKILADKKLTRRILEARKNGSKCSPYKPLAEKEEGVRRWKLKNNHY